uniref:Secreted protein n=1 Tax=Anopheles darlingi TaxID=43151 RepID=A0A2M4DHC9_ANODA
MLVPLLVSLLLSLLLLLMLLAPSVAPPSFGTTSRDCSAIALLAFCIITTWQQSAGVVLRGSEWYLSIGASWKSSSSSLR